MRIFDNRGMSVLEVAVSGAILALVLLGVASFSQMNAKSNQSNNLGSSFVGTMTSFDEIIKTPACDQLFANLPLNDALPLGQPQVFPSGVMPAPAAGFSPSPLPVGLAFGGPNDPPPFQFTLLSSRVDTSTPPSHVYYQDTVSFQMALMKVDSTGKPMPGAAVQIKTYMLNLWVDSATHLTIPYAAGFPGTCTYRKASITGMNASPLCTSPGTSVTFTWTEPVGSTAVVTPSPAWGIGPTTLPVNTNTWTYATPAGDQPTLGISVTVTDPLGAQATAVSPNIQSYMAPIINPTTQFVPTTVTSLPLATSPMNVSTQHANSTGGTVTIVNPPIAGNLIEGLNPAVPVAIAGPGTPGTVYNFTVVATNGCGVSTAAVPPPYIASITYQ
jgi:hypothetical protein